MKWWCEFKYLVGVIEWTWHLSDVKRNRSVPSFGTQLETLILGCEWPTSNTRGYMGKISAVENGKNKQVEEFLTSNEIRETGEM